MTTPRFPYENVRVACYGLMMSSTSKTNKTRSGQWVQLGLESARKPTGHGGWRPGAGRPEGRKTVSHDKRPELVARNPLHVTWRAGAHAPNLRGYYPDVFIREAIAGVSGDGFSVVEYSIMTNHLHLLIEASTKRELERGMRRLARRIIGKLKTKFRWKGKLFTRYHARSLTTPRRVRNALRYVLLNMRHHVGPGARQDPFWVDPYSSGYWFDGWKYQITRNYKLVQQFESLPRPTAIARTWLLAVGWRRWGLLGFDEVPAASPRKR